MVTSHDLRCRSSITLVFLARMGKSFMTATQSFLWTILPWCCYWVEQKQTKFHNPWEQVVTFHIATNWLLFCRTIRVCFWFQWTALTMSGWEVVERKTERNTFVEYLCWSAHVRHGIAKETRNDKKMEWHDRKWTKDGQEVDLVRSPMAGFWNTKVPRKI